MKTLLTRATMLTMALMIGMIFLGSVPTASAASLQPKRHHHVTKHDKKKWKKWRKNHKKHWKKHHKRG